jgi:excisionase family DNA binding protein
VELLTVKEAAKELGVTVGRIHHFIREGRLPAEKLGSQYVIKKGDLPKVEIKPTGRPPKVKVEAGK